jgi:putative ubiquitin-RnfH superfamily antitoxin RatB of RatAB toxin-antitoxin module
MRKYPCKPLILRRINQLEIKVARGGVYKNYYPTTRDYEEFNRVEIWRPFTFGYYKWREWTLHEST